MSGRFLLSCEIISDESRLQLFVSMVRDEARTLLVELETS